MVLPLVASDAITPESEEYELTREAIVKEFNDLDSGLNVIIANPFAVAESIRCTKLATTPYILSVHLMLHISFNPRIASIAMDCRLVP